MGYVEYVGRIGALAVALGVWAAVAAPGTAQAQPADTGPSTAADGSTPVDDTVGPADDVATENATDISVEPDDSPDEDITDGADDPDDDLGGDHASASADRGRGAAFVAAPSEPALDDDEAVTDGRPELADAEIDAAADLPDADGEPPALLLPADGGEAPAESWRSDVMAFSATATPQPELTRVIGEPKRVAPGGFADLVNLLAWSPQNPDGPLQMLWAGLALARDQRERTLFSGGTLPDAAAQPVAALDLTPFDGPAPPQVQLVLPKLLDPSTWVPFAQNVVHDLNVLVLRNVNIYDFSEPTGWLAFGLDYTWALPGTMIGYGVQIFNFFLAEDPGYRDDLSYQQNRHVYQAGMPLSEEFATTLGNVIFNAATGESDISLTFIEQHEELHIWQGRFFGPLFLATYAGWGVGGALVGTLVWLTDTDEDLFSLVATAAYYDNPFEYWAYKNNNYWPPVGANPKLAWPW